MRQKTKDILENVGLGFLLFIILIITIIGSIEIGIFSYDIYEEQISKSYNCNNVTFTLSNSILDTSITNIMEEKCEIIYTELSVWQNILFIVAWVGFLIIAKLVMYNIRV